MKNKTAKSVLGTSILALSLSSQAQSTPKKSLQAITPKLIQDFEIQVGDVKLKIDILTISKIKNIKVKDSTNDLKTMLDGSKTEGAEK